MNDYQVRWEIDMEADSPEEAAAKALIVQRDNDPANVATVFDVAPLNPVTLKHGPWVRVDLSNGKRG